ncbi:uncharacterized protein C3orf14 homolog [Lingula anatina]|uniref:Uncharacterized protein C3orf14 homolog n=1 Tax=Lingula anatina TaxID=7574 RepID=A0A1S3I5P0_LINAN|nr:uncharacterized protein C3orf14 homolog [Lingula anatina]|eukprot:XP_013393590.1 uncharacterized protein C3orf14 homolog [Lingula anatina]
MNVKGYDTEGTYVKKELRLNMKHEQILAQRQALLNGTEAYYDSRQKRASEFVSSYNRAMERNQRLREEIHNCMRGMQKEKRRARKEDSEFENLKDNYWNMVKKCLPKWEEELDKQKNLPS